VRQVAGKPNPTDQAPEEKYRAWEEKGPLGKHHLPAATSGKDRQSTPLYSTRVHGQMGIQILL